MAHRATHELYAEQLRSLEHGYALYEPDPGEGVEEVQNGDVGYIFYGRFKRLASVFSSADGIPALDVPKKERASYYTDLSKGVMSSKSISSGSVEVPGSGDPADVQNRFSRKYEQGTSLVTKYRSRVERATKPKLLQKHFDRNCLAWFNNARRQSWPVENLHDLVLVTGRVMTGDWAMMTFNNSNNETSTEFSIQAANMNASGTLWSHESNEVTFPTRHGPRRSTAMSEGTEPPLNQCIFIETYRVFDRKWYQEVSALARYFKGDSTLSKDRSQAIDSAESAILGLSASDSASGIVDLGDDQIEDFSLNVYEVVAFMSFKRSTADFLSLGEDVLQRWPQVAATCISKIDGMPPLEGLSVIISEKSGRKIGAISFESEDTDALLDTALELLRGPPFSQHGSSNGDVNSSNIQDSVDASGSLARQLELLALVQQHLPELYSSDSE